MPHSRPPHRDIIIPSPAPPPRRATTPPPAPKTRTLPNGAVVRVRRCAASNGFSAAQEAHALALVRRLHKAQIDDEVAADAPPPWRRPVGGLWIGGWEACY